MRFPRVKAEGQSFYHCVCRVVARRFIFQAGYGPARCQALQQELKSVFDLSPSLDFDISVHRWIYPAFPARLAVFGERFFAHLGRDSL